MNIIENKIYALTKYKIYVKRSHLTPFYILILIHLEKTDSLIPLLRDCVKTIFALYSHSRDKDRVKSKIYIVPVIPAKEIV